MKSYLIGVLFGSLSVVLWGLLIVLIDYFDLIELNFYEDKVMMVIVMLVIPLALFYLLLKMMSQSKKFMIVFLSMFTILSLILMTVNS